MLRSRREHLQSMEDSPLNDLAFASEHGRINIVRLLLEQGADANARSGQFRQSSPLEIAAIGNRAEIVDLLASAGAVIDSRDDIGATPLMRAASLGYGDTVRTLLRHGADINARDRYGSTPLMWAVTFWEIDVVRVLLAAGADVRIRDHKGQTASNRAEFTRPHVFTIGRWIFGLSGRKGENDVLRLLREAEKGD